MKREMMPVLRLRLRACLVHARYGLIPFAVLAIWSTGGVPPGLAQESTAPTFPTPSDASRSLFEAVKSNDERTIANILGGPTELTSSGDQDEDKADREVFVRKYQEMHRVALDDAGSVRLYIGAENWPFPIPLVQKDGAWHFDPAAGEKEVTFRRVGENELAAIGACKEFVTAGNGHRTNSKPADPEDGSPTSLLANATAGSTSREAVPFYGYYFRTLGKDTGTPVLIAYPVAYRSSGVMTFVATGGRVYEKDLGANTSALASTMTAFRKDGTWHVVNE
jgi:hypothetical protein